MDARSERGERARWSRRPSAVKGYVESRRAAGAPVTLTNCYRMACPPTLVWTLEAIDGSNFLNEVNVIEGSQILNRVIVHQRKEHHVLA